jgi:hypothetical protein
MRNSSAYRKQVEKRKQWKIFVVEMNGVLCVVSIKPLLIGHFSRSGALQQLPGPVETSAVIP